jgi:hypothetical protein
MMVPSDRTASTAGADCCHTALEASGPRIPSLWRIEIIGGRLALVQHSVEDLLRPVMR